MDNETREQIALIRYKLISLCWQSWESTNEYFRTKPPNAMNSTLWQPAGQTIYPEILAQSIQEVRL